jgi:hypothetical protein
LVILKSPQQCGLFLSQHANVYPHFVGVFDTVAALLNPEMTAAFVVVFLFFDRSAS